MARTFDDSSSQSLNASTVPLSDVPFTMACWFNATGSAAVSQPTLMSFGNGGHLWLKLSIDQDNLKTQVRSYDGTTKSIESTTTLQPGHGTTLVAFGWRLMIVRYT